MQPCETITRPLSSALRGPSRGMDAVALRGVPFDGPAMDFFVRLGDDLDARWRERGYREDVFPSLAASVLRQHDAPRHVDPDTILEWILGAHRLPTQGQKAADFTATLYSTERFFLDVNYWVDGVTTIHDHCAWGAVQTLAGTSLECEYDFAASDRVTSYMACGDLRIRSTSFQRPGHVQEIPLGPAHIHSVRHLTRPAVSLVIFTRSPLHYAQNFTYLAPGLAYVRDLEETRLERQLQALEVIAETRPRDYVPALARYVGGSDVMYAFRALAQAHVRLDGEGLARVEDAALAKHGELARTWSLALRERRRQDELSARRASVSTPEHRLLFALLSTPAPRAQLLEAVRGWTSERDPVDTFVDWARELAAIPLAGEAGPTLLGAPLDDAGLVVLRGLMRGLDHQGVMQLLEAEFDPAGVRESEAAILDLIAAFRESALFARIVS